MQDVRLRLILVALSEDDSASRALMLKALQIARCTGAHLHLFHAVVSAPLRGALSQARRRAAVSRLARLVIEMRSNGLQAGFSVRLDNSVVDAIVREAQRRAADLVIVSGIGQRRFPWLFGTVGWSVLVKCGTPLLLVKSAAPYSAPHVLAALDPLRSHAKPAELDLAILHTASLFAKALQGSLHAMHVQDLSSLNDPESGDPAHDRSTLQQELAAAGNMMALTHFPAGEPVEVIRRMVDEISCQLVVIGAADRSPLWSPITGHIARRALGALPCDLLIVHAPGFKVELEPIELPALPAADASA